MSGPPFTPEQKARVAQMMADKKANFPRTTGRFISPEYTSGTPPQHSNHVEDLVDFDPDRFIAVIDQQRSLRSKESYIFREGKLVEERLIEEFAKFYQSMTSHQTAGKRKRNAKGKGKGKEDKLKN